MIGDRLYTLTERDVQARWLEPTFRFWFAGPTAAVNVDATLAAIIGQGFALLLLTFMGRATPGAAQNVVNMFWEVRQTSALPPIFLKESRTALAANVTGILDWQGEVIITPQMTTRFGAAFNAGAAGNSVEAYITGMRIPLGNIEHA